jgi:SAM-dependent methyltransferase
MAKKKRSAKVSPKAPVRATKKKSSVKAKARFDQSISKYVLYESAVQCPDWHVKYFPEFHEWILGKEPLKLREDFCGTARISCDWVKKSPKHRAVGLDLDPEPLAYGFTENVSKLPAAAQGRVKLIEADVREVTTEKFDLVAACNFSFFIFHERAELVAYFKSVYKSLDKKGTFFLEMAGGEGMLEKLREGRSFRVKGFGKFEYVWEQHQYDPISAVSDYSIHFQMPNRRWMKDVFTYHWRLWGIREVREILREAGFQKTNVFWETADGRGQGTGDYVPSETGDHAHSWIAYVVGVKTGEK